jgi:succinyl-diaminopimelate desuccinylase
MNKNIIDLTKKLISIPSVSRDIAGLQTAFDLVEREFQGYPLIVKRFESNKKPSLVVTLTDTQTPEIFLNGHLDVVTGKADQFSPRIVGDKLLGRGAYDMKAACAVMIQLLKDLSKTMVNKHRVGLMLVPDEEVGGFDGSGYLLEEGYKPTELFLAGEGTNFAVERETKGVLWIRLIARGQTSHAAYPWRGNNAILALSSSLHRLAGLYPTPQSDSWTTTSVVSSIAGGGQAMNLVPDYSEATVDIRYVAGDIYTDILEKVKSVLEQEVEIEVILHQYPHNTHEGEESLLRLQRITKDVTGQLLPMVKNPGISDTKFYSRENIPACGFGPRGDHLHQDNEYVELESLDEYYEILRRLVQD